MCLLERKYEYSKILGTYIYVCECYLIRTFINIILNLKNHLWVLILLELYITKKQQINCMNLYFCKINILDFFMKLISQWGLSKFSIFGWWRGHKPELKPRLYTKGKAIVNELVSKSDYSCESLI